MEACVVGEEGEEDSDGEEGRFVVDENREEKEFVVDEEAGNFLKFFTKVTVCLSDAEDIANH